MERERTFGCRAIALSAATIALAVMPPRIAIGEDQQGCLDSLGPVASAVDFVETHFGATIAGYCIRVVTVRDLDAVFARSSGIIDDLPELGGMFDPSSSTVYLPDTLDLSVDLDLSFLVHELVHVYQFADPAHRRGRERGSLECEAYMVQASFLRSSGLDQAALTADLLGQLQAMADCDF